MIIESLKTIFERDLNRLKTEIETYQKEENLWKTDKNITNSAGNLTLHLLGNLNHFIGAVIGKTGYVRNRDLEFTDKNIPRKELLKEIDAVIKTINTSLDQVNTEDLEIEYPIVVYKDKMSTGFFLIHLTGHLNYHLGQINYHRRLLDF